MYLALGFMSLVMFVSPVPGWYMWVYPLIVFCFIKYIDFPRFAIIGLNGFYLLYFLFSTKFSEFGLFSLFSINSFVTTTETQFNSLLFTPLLAIMIYIMFLILRLGNEHNNLFNYRTNPLMIGVGGDSGAGKNYMHNLISKLFSHGTLCVEGDDDHKWERGHQQWQAYTHLNPKANNLYVQFDNTIDLKKGRSVYKSNYDHSTGNFSNPNAVSPNDTIFFLGLHAFYLPQMRGLFDLKIFLDPEEKLRQEWKINRDKKERNYDKKTVTENIAKRNPDSQNYIRPQLKFADIVIRNKTKKGEFYTTFVIKNEWDLSQLINHIEGKIDNNFEFSHTFDYQNDTQIIKFSGKIKKTFFDHYLNDLVISNDLFDINFPKGENAQNLMTQVIVLTMLSHIAKK
jgi:uridine kinase